MLDNVAKWVGRPGGVVVLIVAAFLFSVVFRLEAMRRTVDVSASSEALYIRSPEALGLIALSFDSVLADVYWIRVLQHYGRTKLSDDADKSYAQLYPLLDITTTLDPRFNIAYRFGSVFLAEPHPSGPGRPDLAIALLEKGVRAMPDRWEYLMEIGFVHYWWRNDYAEAARWFRRAGDVPGAAWWLDPLAATTLAQGGNRAGSRLLWQQLHDDARDPWLRHEAERRLMQLDALDEIDRLHVQANGFESARGHWPESWEALVQAGLIDRTPIDPTGEVYQLDRPSRSVRLSPMSTLGPLPDASSVAVGP